MCTKMNYTPEDSDVMEAKSPAVVSKWTIVAVKYGAGQEK